MPVALTSLIQRAFRAGELAPALAARADLPLYGAGLRTCRNFLVQRSGGVSNRPGLQFVAACKDGEARVTLYRWTFTAADRSVLIECGDQYFRFYENGDRITIDTPAAWDIGEDYVAGDLVRAGGINYVAIAESTGDTPASSPGSWYPLEDDIYEIPTPYTANTFDSPGPLRFTQNGAKLTITHPAYAPMELENLTNPPGPPIWILSPATFAPAIDPPSSLTYTAGTPTGGGRTLAYQVTAVAADNLEESLPTAPATAADAGEPTEAAPDLLEWTAPAQAAVEYRVYMDPFENGTFGYIGTATGMTSFLSLIHI